MQGYLREDGLWDVEAELKDTKSYELELISRGRVPVGGYLHRMIFRLTVDDQLIIREVDAGMADTPYPDCNGASERYQELIGLKIKSGWLEEAKSVLGRKQGCTHLTELLPVLATGAIQTIRGYQINNDSNHETIINGKKYMLDSCYGFRDGGLAAHTFWPDEDHQAS